MFINLKNYFIEIYYIHKTKLENIDSDFWGDIFLYELEEVY